MTEILERTVRVLTLTLVLLIVYALSDAFVPLNGFFNGKHQAIAEVQPAGTKTATSIDYDIETVIKVRKNSPGLFAGYNYHLLSKFAESNNIKAEINLDRTASTANLSGPAEIDITAVPLSDSLSISDSLTTIIVDSISIWIIRDDKPDLAESVRHFLEGFMAADSYGPIHTSYTQTYDPKKWRKRENISPYDSIIKNYADTLRCDWRLLAAIIYQESHFRIEAISSRGACGLMQLMPETAKHYGVTDLVDPEMNILAGSRFLRKIMGQFAGISATPEDRMNMTLAAYNAGTGRIRDCITVARMHEKDPGYWDNLVSVIPHMRDSSILDEPDIRCGIFQGYETIAYVQKVNYLYNSFRKIHPEE